ncbi:GNAT family N-acetyltransferase [Rhizobium sp. 2YAF20]|uniref:GNAT family N-acetyltransferase n=1 Tax=Rhizobium sp. 2YAF20 TaxID=3233027 RepID=UPI003F9A078C
MQLTIRELRQTDARAFLEIHHAAVRGSAAHDYSAAVIEAWAPLPITDRSVQRVVSNPDGEHRLIAEIDGLAVGIGALVAKNSELRACYVHPVAGRKGVGSTLLLELERIAVASGLMSLSLDSSLTAEGFYRSRGYVALGYEQHLLSGGVPMACIKMRKVLLSQNS